MIYEFTQDEFDFIRAFCEMPLIEGFKPLAGLDAVGDLEAAARSLEKKGYMTKDPEGGYYMPDELTFYLMAIGQASSAFSIDREEKHMSVFFKGDTIVTIIKEDGLYQIIWIPFMHLLVGAVSDFMAPYLNAASGEASEDLAEGSDFIEDSVVSFFEAHAPVIDRSVTVYSDGKTQIMKEVSEGQAFWSAPDKADMINTLTRVTSRMHGTAIREVLE